MNSRMIVYCVAAWLVPGLGHFLLKRWIRGVIICAAVITMLAIGMILKGGFLFHTGAEQGMMHLFHLLSTSGNGAFFLLNYLSSTATLAQIQDALKTQTFEYGVRFVAASGLLNYLSILDAADIALGRKE